MRTPKWRAAILAGILSCTALIADQWNKKTVITIDTPVQIPTMTLQPGSYTIKLLESASNRHIVTIWDKDGMKLVTTLMAIPNYRLQVTGDSKFTFWETPADQPKAMRAWFYPGDNFGQEFAYPKEAAQAISAVAKAEVPTLSDSDSARIGEAEAMAKAEKVETPAEPAQAAATPPVDNPQPAPAVATAPEPAPAPAAPANPVAQAPEPGPAPAPAATPEPAQSAPQAAEMPQTASNSTEILLIGFGAAMLGFMAMRLRQRV